jgi:hypothetical protein
MNWVKKLSKILAVAATLVFISSCSWFTYKSPNSFYNHEKHVEILYKQDKNCFYCHTLPNLEKMDEETIKKVILQKKDLKIDGKCHTCHRNPETRLAEAPFRCETCHVNMKDMKPADHIKGWDRIHSIQAKTNKKECQKCHSDRFCDTCHKKVYNVVNFKHPASFRTVHSLNAMIDPASCGTCHRVSFCNECHRKR